MNKKLQILTNGLLKENPSLRLVLGTCPTLAITTMASNGLGMGLAATFVLIGSNVAVSALRKVIPDKVRLPAFITIIASFVTVLMMAVKAFLPDLDQALGVYLPLITTNCAVLGVTMLVLEKGAEDPTFGYLQSLVNSFGSGIGFLVAMVLFAGVRERLENCDIPETFKGLPITLVAASLVAVSFLGFNGVVDNLL